MGTMGMAGFVDLNEYTYVYGKVMFSYVDELPSKSCRVGSIWCTTMRSRSGRSAGSASTISGYGCKPRRTISSHAPETGAPKGA